MLLHKIAAFVAAIAVTVPASAQFSNSGSSSSSSDLCKSYNRIGVSYTNTGLSANKEFEFIEDKDHISLNGFAVDYIHGFSLSKTLPMFIETGVKANFGFGSVESDEDYWSEKLQMQNIYLSVPVNFAYKFGVSDNVSITPYIGLNLKLHLLGRVKYEYEDEYDDDEESEWYNVFSKDDMDDETWNRFQLGWHIGAGVNIKKLYLGVSYGTDFIKAFKHKDASVNSGNLSATIGYTF